MNSLAEYAESPIYTVNIDLTTGNVIGSEDVFGNFNVITSAFIGGDFEFVSGMDDLLSYADKEDMILQYKSDYASYPDVYFLPGELALCIDLVASLGSSAVFTISIEEIEDALVFTPN